MNKHNIKSKTTEAAFPSGKSYSIDAILAAGGATAFANKLGKTPEAIAEKLSHLPVSAFLTPDEAEAAFKILDEQK